MLRATSFDDCVRLAELAIGSRSAEQARQAVRAELPVLAALGL